MNIDRSKHNKFVSKAVYTEKPITDNIAGAGGSQTIIIQGGGGSGSGLTDLQIAKLNGIEKGALKNQNAISSMQLRLDTGQLISKATKPSSNITLGIKGDGQYTSTIIENNEVKVKLLTDSIKALIDETVYNGSYWKLDKDGNLFTEYNAYSKLELSAYGMGDTDIPVYASYLHELKDVDVSAVVNDSILQYNSAIDKWVATDGSLIKPDLAGYATESWVANTYASKIYVLEEIAGIIDSAPATLDTLKELAAALGDDPNFSTTVLNKIGSNTSLITALTTKVDLNTNDIASNRLDLDLLLSMFEWDKSDSLTDITKWKIKAKNNFYSTGEVSAYGNGTGGGGGGSEYLKDLKDVSLSSALTGNDILMYNGTNWVNTPSSTISGSSDWDNIANKPTWIGSSKPTYTKSEIGLGNVDNTSDSSKNVLSATRLTTARTLWGQSFNGTSNISGSIVGCTALNGGGSALTLGNVGNSSYINVVEDIRQPSDNWKITVAGAASFNSLTVSNTISGTITSATKLQTTRTIWGQSFNGTGDVNGLFRSLSGRGNLDVQKLLTDANSPYGLITSISSNGAATLQVQRENNAAETFSLFLNPKGGVVHIGTWSGPEVLNVGGWVGTQGATGWYNSTYGGGIYMTDTTYVRVSSGKRFYVPDNSLYGIFNEGSYHSNRHTVYSGTWQNVLNPENALLWSNQRSMNTGNVHNIIGWSDIHNGQGYVTRYSIASIRNGGWGSMVFSVGTSDNGISGRQLVLNGNGTAEWAGDFVANGEVTAYSDIRLKSNINNLLYRGRLTPKTYVKDNKPSIGFIALEVLTLYPELVHTGTDENHYLSLNYGSITAVLASQLNGVEDEVSVLKNRVKQLEDRLSRYES